MILKIKFHESWVYYDNITKIRYGTSGQKLALLDENGTLYFRDYEGLSDQYHTVMPSALWIHFHKYPDRHEELQVDVQSIPWAICKIKGEEQFVGFNIGYLLNDDGKTLEVFS